MRGRAEYEAKGGGRGGNILAFTER